MDFGKLPSEALSGVNFTMPPDGFSTAGVLARASIKSPQIFVGCPVWADTSWVGRIYPERMQPAKALDHYTRQFNTIELNVTHYQIPTEATIARWKASAEGTDFVFCPKFPQVISHDRQLLDCEILTNQFCTNIQGLGPHLGMPFLQLGPGFNPQKGKYLIEYLKTLPFSVAVEFRHEGWFTSERIWRRTCEVLGEMNHAIVIADVAGRRDVLHQSLSIPTAVVRFVGNNLHPTDYSRTDAWVDRIGNWLSAGLQTLYFFVHCGGNTLAPDLASYFINTMNQRLGTGVVPPEFLPQNIQTRLF